MSCVRCFLSYTQKSAYGVRFSDWSSDVCSSDLKATRRYPRHLRRQRQLVALRVEPAVDLEGGDRLDRVAHLLVAHGDAGAAGGHLHHQPVDQSVEHPALVVDAFELARVEVVTLDGARLPARLFEGVAELVLVDLLPPPQP